MSQSPLGNKVAERKDRFAVLSRYEKHCKAANIQNQIINKYNEQWAADALLESFPIQDIYDSMSYYFEISSNPTWKGFANNVDRLIQSKAAKEEDDRLRSERRKKAKEWLSQ
jgi:hypothetical protein